MVGSFGALMKLRDIACVSGFCMFLYLYCSIFLYSLSLIIGILESLSTKQRERIDPAHLEMMISNFLKGFGLKRIGAEPSSIYHSRLVDLLPIIVMEKK